MQKLLTMALFLPSSYAGSQQQNPPLPPQGDKPMTNSDQLAERTLHARAVQAVIWGMPAVNYDLMLQEMLTKTTGKVGQVIYWGRPLDYRNQKIGRAHV